MSNAASTPTGPSYVVVTKAMSCTGMASPAVVRVHLCYWACNIMDQLRSCGHSLEASMSDSLDLQTSMHATLSWLLVGMVCQALMKFAGDREGVGASLHRS